MNNENEIKHNQITYNIKQITRAVQWMDFLHMTDDLKMKDFFRDIYGEESADEDLEEKLSYLRRRGVIEWMYKLDNRNITRFYNLVMRTDPTNWWLDYSKENRKQMQDMINNAIEKVTDRIEEEVNTQLKDEMDKHGLTPEDLGADPKESFDEHQDDE